MKSPKIWPVASRTEGEDAAEIAFAKSSPLSAENRQQIVAARTDGLIPTLWSLSPLGAWLDVDAHFQQTPLSPLDQWVHRSTMGRDHYVRTVERGYLYPTGHRAVHVTVSARTIGDNMRGEPVAYIEKKRYVQLRDPELP
jgi:hypothetical protein